MIEKVAVRDFFGAERFATPWGVGRVKNICQWVGG